MSSIPLLMMVGRVLYTRLYPFKPHSKADLTSDQAAAWELAHRLGLEQTC
jgi:hypothetical protein